MSQTLQSLGQALRQAREGRGLSVEQAERETRIRAKFLTAIENGDITGIPSRVQARGFLFNYAQYLGLNAADIVAQFDSQGRPPTEPGIAPAPVVPSAPAQPSGPAQPPVAPPPITPQPISEPPPQQALIPRLITPPQPIPIPTPLPGVPEENGTAPPAERTFVQRLLASDLFLISALALLAVLALSIGGLALRDLPTGETDNTPSAFMESLNGDDGNTPTPTFQPTSTPTATVPPLANDRVRVSIEVTQRNWMTVDVDGENVFQGLAEPDTILQYEGLSEVRVTTGNAGGLSVTYNGAELGPLGERGQLVERIYTIEGLQTLTPTPSPTITPTPIPTATGTPGPSPTSTQTPPATATRSATQTVLPSPDSP